MSPDLLPYPRRGWLGTRQVLRYNRHWYAAATAGLLLLAVAAVALPAPLSWACLAAALALATGTAASLLVPHVVYDLSDLHRWTWFTARAQSPRRILVVHAGLDEASDALAQRYPSATVDSVDIFDPQRMTEPSIRVARAGAATRRIRFDRLDAEGPTDVAVLLMSAHELRSSADRATMLRSLGNALELGGRIVLVEHLRDAANVAAFGPGAWHFHTRRQWFADLQAAGLRVADEHPITPWVRAFWLERAP